MIPEKLLLLYQDLQAYVGLTEEDVRNVRSIAHIITPHLTALIDDFYNELVRHPEAAQVITGGAVQIERLKGKLRGWVEDLLSANCDQDYVWRRWMVGWRHVEIGLAQVYTNAAMSRLRSGFNRVLSEVSATDVPEIPAAIRALNKLIDLDLAIIEDAYQAEYMARQDRVRRLATIGEISGGIAHELRNPLGIMKNAVYFLRMSLPKLSDDDNDAFDELGRGLKTCNRLVGELLDFVREPKREATLFPLREAIDEALAGIDIPASIRLTLPIDRDVHTCRADKGQIVQIIDNLVRNAVEAMPSGGILTLNVKRDDNIVVEVVDSGNGIAVGDLDKVFEPLFSRKAKGIGLGLAVARRYAELNQGSLKVESDPGRGATFRLTLPAV